MEEQEPGEDGVREFYVEVYADSGQAIGSWELRSAFPNSLVQVRNGAIGLGSGLVALESAARGQPHLHIPQRPATSQSAPATAKTPANGNAH